MAEPVETVPNAKHSQVKPAVRSASRRHDGQLQSIRRQIGNDRPFTFHGSRGIIHIDSQSRGAIIRQSL